MGVGDLGQPHARQVGVPELQHTGASENSRPFDRDVPELDEREQEPPRGGAGEPGLASHLAQGEPRAFGTERADHGEAAFERLDEVAALARGALGALRCLPGRSRLLLRGRRPDGRSRTTVLRVHTRADPVNGRALDNHASARQSRCGPRMTVCHANASRETHGRKETPVALLDQATWNGKHLLGRLGPGRRRRLGRSSSPRPARSSAGSASATPARTSRARR